MNVTTEPTVRTTKQLTEYEYMWRNKWLTADAESIDDMIAALQAAADELRAMKAKGVTLDESGDVSGDHAILVTTDPAVAQEFNFAPREWDDLEVGDDECAE